MAAEERRTKAVDLRYDEKTGAAPKVVAGGSGLIAQRIIEAAKEAGVFIKEDPDLVELLAKVPIGDEVPEEMYQTVAEILAFVYSVNEKFKHKIKPGRKS